MNPSQLEDLVRKDQEAIARADVIKSRISPAGALKLPPLLDERRLHYGIPDGAFSGFCLYDRIYVAQINDGDGKFGDTMLYMPQKSAEREAAQAPRGLIVAAGLLALDNLRSNGSDLGHIVHFVRASIWRRVVDVVNGKEIDVIVLRDGDLTADEDVERMRRSGEMTIEWDEKQRRHYWRRGKKALQPQKPWIPEDT